MDTGVRSRPADGENWWLISNRHGGVHRAPGDTAAEARAYTRAAIAESFEGEGLSPSAARRAAASYAVWTVAGPAPYEDVREAWEAWDGDLEPAAVLARRTGHHRVAKVLIGQVAS